ncbi:MAG: hypothetical protein DRI95_01045 [Bacteroidetes bacterium]|nr:MAG: hypothetical protein DRI95_01045 [Bacteroidota bacterium]
MDIDQLFSIIEKKDSYTEETISEVKELIESFPYFQTGHMLLLKAMHTSKPEKFNDQLNISGSFIADKKMLFQFINTDIGATQKPEEEPVKKRIRRDRRDQTSRSEREDRVSRRDRTDRIPGVKTERKTDEIKPEVKKDVLQTEKESPVKEIKTEIRKSPELEKEPEIKKEIKTEIKTTIPEQKKEVETKKEVEFEVTKVEKEPQVKLPEIKKPETKLSFKETKKPEAKLSSEEIGDKISTNSKKRHKKIVQDFFIDPNKDIVIIDETTDQIKIPQKKETVIKEELSIDKKEPVVDQNISELAKKERPELKTDEVLKKEKIAHLEGNATEREQRTEPIKEKPLVRDRLTRVERKKNVTEQKTKLVKEERTKIEEKKVVEEKKPFVRRKQFTNDSKVPVAKVEKPGTRKQSDVMNDIFSKIRAIKKEMNISSEDSPETIDVNSNIGKRRRNRIVEPEDLKIEDKEITKVEKEKEETPVNIVEKKDLIKEKTEEDQVDKTDEKTVTAKDLFNLHRKKKEEKKDDKVEEPTKSKIESLFDKPDSFEKSVVVEEKKTEIKKEEPKEIVKKEEPKVPVKREKVEKEKSTSEHGGVSAADALLKRIASKKQKIKEEPIVKKEEIEKVEDIPLVKEEPVNKLEEDKKELVEPFEFKKEEVETKIEETKEEISKSKDLIDNFINTSDSRERMTDKDTTLKGDISGKSSEEKEEFMTEAMADLFVQQKYYDKALNVYNKLILKFPQKKTYFAIQIKKVESLIKNNK